MLLVVFDREEDEKKNWKGEGFDWKSIFMEKRDVT